MSNIIQEIKAAQNGRKYATVSPVKNFLKIEEDYFKPTPYSIGYTLGVTLEQNIIVSDEDRAFMGSITEKVRASMAESVFGEFRPMLYELNIIASECYCSETRTKIFQIVDNILDKMFVEGVR